MFDLAPPQGDTGEVKECKGKCKAEMLHEVKEDSALKKKKNPAT